MKIWENLNEILKYNNIHLSLLLNFINRICEENCVNPVYDYLDNCYKNFDNEKVYIQKLCDAIIDDNEFDKTIKEMLIMK